MRGKNLLLAFTLATSTTIPAHADLDAKNRDYLIEKLNKVYLTLAPVDNSKVAVTLRLADLLAERARIASMEEMNSGCSPCNAGAADRKQALNLYMEVVDKVPATSKGKVMVQMGHLQQLLGNDKQAVELYNTIAADSTDPMTQAEAHLSIAEIHYKKSQWPLAQAAYEKVLNIPSASARGFAAYRRSWALFNQGKIKEAQTAIIDVLKTPALLSKGASAVTQVDSGFHEEVAGDLVTFLGKDFSSESYIQTLFDLSPEKTRLTNVGSLAAELERVGKKDQALKAWDFVYQRQSNPQYRIEILAHVAVLNLEMGQKDQAKEAFKNVFVMAPQVKEAFPKETENTKKILRQAIITWNQADKKNLTMDLLNAYQNYLSVFGYDREMSQWAVQLAGDLSVWDQAWSLHLQAISNIEPKDLENHLLLGIELAEKSKKPELMAAAQDEYLARSQQKTQWYQVKYQKAYRLYDSDKTAEALPLLREIVLDAKAPADLRVKAGDLTLDAIALQKDDTKLEATAVEFQTSLGNVKGISTEWLSIGQKAILNQSASLASTSTDAAWTKLLSFDVSKAEEKDKVTYYKNKMALAEKRQDVTAGLNAAMDLSRLPNLSVEDKNLAQMKMAQFHDLKMNFKEAMKITEALPDSAIGPDKKALKLALYADLTGTSSIPYLKKYVDLAKTEEEKIAASGELVKKSKDFEVEFSKQKNLLMKKPEYASQILLDKYTESKSPALLTLIEKDEKLKTTAAGRVMIRDLVLKNTQALANKLAVHQLDGKSQKVMTKTLKERAKLLADLDAQANKAIQSGDWSSQLVSLSYVSKESKRFYEEILSLPLPEGLSESEQSEYMNLLGQQASPYKNKAEMAQAKVTEFWARPQWKEELQKPHQDTQEIQALVAVANEADKEFLSKLGTKEDVTGVAAKPSVQELEAARNELRQNPMSAAAIEKLKALEVQSGNKAMVQYLEGRAMALGQTLKQKGM